MAAVLTHYGADDPMDTLGWRSIKCPFHADSHASARYCSSDDVNAFICMACGIKGDSIAIVQEQEGLDFKESVKFIEELSGEELPQGNGGGGSTKRYKPIRLGQEGQQRTRRARKRARI